MLKNVVLPLIGVQKNTIHEPIATARVRGQTYPPFFNHAAPVIPSPQGEEPHSAGRGTSFCSKEIPRPAGSE